MPTQRDLIHAQRHVSRLNAEHDAGMLALDLAEAAGHTATLPTDVHLLLSAYLRGCTRCGQAVALSTVVLGVHNDDVAAGVDHSAKVGSNSDDSGDELWRLPPDEDDHRPSWLREKHLAEAREAKLAKRSKGVPRVAPRGTDGSLRLPRRLAHAQLEGWCGPCHAVAGGTDTEAVLDECATPLATMDQLIGVACRGTHIAVTGTRISDMSASLTQALRHRLDAFAAADAPTTGNVIPPLLGFTCSGVGMKVERRSMSGAVVRGAPLSTEMASLLTLVGGHARSLAVLDSDLEVSLVKALAANHNEKMRNLTLSGTLWTAQSAVSRSLKGEIKADFGYLRDVGKRFPKLHQLHISSVPPDFAPGRAVTGAGVWWECEGLTGFRVPVPNVPDPSYLGETNEQCERRGMIAAPDGLGLSSLHLDATYYTYDMVQRVSRAAWTLTTLHLSARANNNGGGDTMVALLAELPKLTDLTLTNFPAVAGDAFTTFLNLRTPLRRLALLNDVVPPPPPPWDPAMPIPVRVCAGPEDATIDPIVELPFLDTLVLRNAAWLTDKGLAKLVNSRSLTSLSLIGVGRYTGEGFAAYAAQTPAEAATRKLRHVYIEGSLMKTYWPTKKKKTRAIGGPAVPESSDSDEPTDDPDDTRDEATKAADRPRRRELRLQRTPPKFFSNLGLCALALVPSLRSVTLKHLDSITDAGVEALGAGDETLAPVNPQTGLSESDCPIEELCLVACQQLTIAPLLRGVEEGAPSFPALRVVRLQGHRLGGVLSCTAFSLEDDAPELVEEMTERDAKVRELRREIRSSFQHLRPKLQVHIVDV